MKNISTFILLGLISIVGVFTLDVYLPGMPAMADQFGVSINQICRTFTLFSIAFAVSQLIYGTLSDYVGRKPILITGLIVSAIATAFCIYARSYESLLAARILQAIGIAVFVVLNAIIRDLYSGTIAVQVRTYVNTVSGISISIAPTIGGLLLNRFNWQGGFIASLILILITLLYAILFFSESNINRYQHKLKMTMLAKIYFHLFSNKNYLVYVLIATLAFTMHFSFIVISAKIFIDKLGFAPHVFGYLMFVYGGVYFVSGLVTTYISKQLSISNLIKLGGMLIGIGGIAMYMLTPLSNATGILLPMALITMGVTSARGAAITCALAPIPEQAGLGAAALNLIQFIFSAIIATVVTEISDQPNLTLALLAIVCSIAIITLIHLIIQMRATENLIPTN